MWQNSAWMIALAWREKEKKVLVLAVLVALFAVATNLVELYVVPSILGAVERQAPIGELAGTILFFVAALMLCRAGAAYLDQNVMYGRITVRLGIVSLLANKHLTTSYPNIQDETFLRRYAKAQSCTGGNDQATEAIWKTLSTLLQNILGFILYLLLLTAVHPMLFGLILVTSVVSYCIAKHANNYLLIHEDEIEEYSNRMWIIKNKASDTTTAKDIRIFGLRPWLEELNQKAMDVVEAYLYKAQIRVFWGHVADLVLTFLRNAVAYAYLIGLVLSGGLTAAEFLLYFSAVSGFAEWISGILNAFVTLHRQSIDLSVIREVIEYPELFTFEGGESLAVDNAKQYELKLENVTYRYPNTDKDILTNINLTLHPGEKVAVVGLNGAGKTTLVKLICGFLDPTAGRVLLNGKDIRDYNRRDYYKLFSAVFQQFTVLPLTVAENVAQTTGNIDMERVKDCIDKAGLKEKIESEPKAYDTLLNREIYYDAIMLSGGETQRLMLARALYKDAPFVILDEPTAALDPIAESELYQKYHEMTAGKSSVYISHRLASTRFCDRILLIEDSVIAEEGTHESLLAQNGKYAELFQVQSRYYKEGGMDNAENE